MTLPRVVEYLGLFLNYQPLALILLEQMYAIYTFRVQAFGTRIKILGKH